MLLLRAGTPETYTLMHCGPRCMAYISIHHSDEHYGMLLLRAGTPGTYIIFYGIRIQLQMRAQPHLQAQFK